MSEQQGQGQGQQVPAAFQAFVQRVAQLGAEHGLQAAVVAAAVPSEGGHGPSTVHSLSWVYGQPSAEWRVAAAQGMAEVALKAAGGLLPAQAPAAAETAGAAAAEGGDAPAVAATEAA